MSKEKSLAKNAIFNALYRLLNVIFPLISATYVAHILLPAGVGHVSFVQNIVSYFTMAAAVGIPTYGVREISKCRNNQNEMNCVFSELFIINGCSTLLCLIGYVALVLLCFSDDLKLYLVCGSLIFFNFINIDWFYSGREDYVYIAVRSSVVKLLSLALIFIFVRDQADYLNYALITCLATGGNYLFNIFHSRKYVHFTTKGLKFKRHFRSILYLAGCAVAAELYSQVDITELGILCNDQVVGFYANAQKLITLVVSLATAITAIFLPRLSFYFENNRNKFDEYLNLGFQIVSFIAVPAFLGIILVSDNLICVMFGEAFMPAAATIRILAPLILIKCLGDLLCYQVIISSGNERIMLKTSVLAAIVNIVLNTLLIPEFKQNGAAFASVISELLLNGILFFAVSVNIIHLRVTIVYVLSITLGVLGMGIVVFVFGNLIENPFLALAIQVLVGVVVYAIINLLLKNELVVQIIHKKKKLM